MTKKDKAAMWRGGAPKKETVDAMLKSAQERGVKLTFIDLRHPPFEDDTSGKGGRLSPKQEEKIAKERGFGYVGINALDKELPAVIEEALQKGDVYIHCMYGVNRTGFASARYAVAKGLKLDREGLGKKDWNDGARFQQNLTR